MSDINYAHDLESFRNWCDGLAFGILECIDQIDDPGSRLGVLDDHRRILLSPILHLLIHNERVDDLASAASLMAVVVDMSRSVVADCGIEIAAETVGEEELHMYSHWLHGDGTPSSWLLTSTQVGGAARYLAQHTVGLAATALVIRNSGLGDVSIMRT